MKIERGKLYQYNGENRTGGITIHQVLYIMPTGPIFTWSLPSARPDIGGDTWMGTREEFLKQFSIP